MVKTTNILDLNNRLEKVEKANVGQNSYTSLKNKPKINSVTLTGNKSLADIGAAAAADLTTMAGDVGNKTNLTTTYKDDLVGAIDEVNGGLTSVTTLRIPTTRSGVTLVSGGYQKIGRMVMISVVIEMTETISDPNTGILWGFPSIGSVNIPMLICEQGKNTFETGNTTRIYQNTIYAGMELTTGKSYVIYGIYETSNQ